MNWIPQSLLSRSVLLISALLVLSQLIWFGLYRTYNVRTQSEYLASQIASVISTVSVALEAMPASARRKFSEKLPAQQNIRLLPATAWDDEEVPLPESPLLQSISDHLKRDFSGDAQALPAPCGSRSRSRTRLTGWYFRQNRAALLRRGPGPAGVFSD